MTHADAHVRALVRRLVLAEVAGRHGGDDVGDDDDDDARERAIDAQVRYATRVLGSTLGASHPSTSTSRGGGDDGEEERDVVGRIVRRVTRARGAAAGAEVGELCERARARGGWTRRARALRALLAISEDVAAGSSGVMVSSSMSSMSSMSSARVEGARGGVVPRLDLEVKAKALARDARGGNVDSTVVDARVTARALAGGAHGALGLHSVGRRADAYRTLKIERAATGECDERELVRDVLFACQGIDGEFVKFSVAEQSYVIAPNVNVSAGRRNLIKCLTEVGWLFKKVKNALRDDGAAGVSMESGEGSTRQAFRAALQRELADYYKLIAVLEAQAQVPIVAYLSDQQNKASTNGDSYLTLRRLFVWLAEPLKTLRTLAVMVDATHNKRGGAALSAMYKFSRHGDPASTALVRRILSASAAPLLGMIQRWTVSGELEDPCREFFVAVDYSIHDNDLWRRKYTFDEDMLPPFMTREQAQSVLRLGKSINFLRRCCDDATWSVERADILNAVEKAGGLQFENPEGLEVLIAEGKARVDTAVRRVLFDRYKLGEHCKALKRYLLLGQGDLHECLMDLIGPSLNQPANTLSAFKLAGTLEQAVRSSSAQTDSSEFLDRLRVRLMAHLNEEVGWDVFTLEYTLTPPLTTIFTEHAMSKYLRVFNFLWRLKRVEHALCSTWQTMKPTVTHVLSRDAVNGATGGILADMLRRCHSLRGEMHNFMSNFQYYVMFEILETSWAEFEQAMEESKDLDAIIASHDVFLDTVVQKALLGSKSQLVLQTLYSLFEVMMTFREFADELYDLATEVVAKKAAARARIAEREKNQQWGTMVGEDSTAEDFLDKDAVHDMKRRLSDLAALYSRQVDGFLNLLPLQTHVDVQFLLFRLDFSEYYASKGVGPGDVAMLT